MKKIFALLVAILVLCAGCGSNAPKEQPKEQPKQTSAFNMDAKTFIERYNAIAKDNVKIKDPKIEKTKKVVYSQKFNTAEILIVENDNKPESVSTISSLPFDKSCSMPCTNRLSEC